MIKGLRCNNCGCQFKWNEASDRKMQGIQSICNCPKCNQLITSDVSVFKFMALIAFAVIFFIMLIWSAINSTLQVAIIIGASGFVLSFFIQPLFFKSGYLQMFKVKNDNRIT